MKKKILIFSIILITIINALMPAVKAVTTITKANLINDHKIDTHLLYYNDERNEWRDIQCGYICYKSDGEKYPAYCIVPNTNGVDEEGAYTVTVNKLLDNKLIYNVLVNGYPYKTPSQLGVQTADDAYVATKLALKNALLDRDVTGFYKAADERGDNILSAMFKIIEKGKSGNLENKHATITINELGDFIGNEKYYYKEYKVTADSNISEYTIDSLEEFPEGTYVTDENGVEKETFLFGQNFRVMIPKSEFNNDILGRINIRALCNTKPIFYGEAPNSKIQDYAITYKPFVEYQKSMILAEKTDKSSIKIQKQDKETLNPIKDVEFGLYNQNDECIMTGITNQDGILIFNTLYQGIYKLKELKANEKYECDETVHEIATEYNKESTKIITNKHKKGNLKITKVDKDDKTITLGAIEFDLINDKGDVIAHLITDVNGEAYIENINIGKYILKETKTKREYNLCENKDIIVDWNKTSEIIIENEKKKGQIKIIKEDEEIEDIKLKGVKFQIIDINNKVIEEIVTDDNGEALSSKLLVGEYKIKEVDLGSNTNYLLNDEIKSVYVEDKLITELHIKNQHKKGSIIIKKVDLDNSNIMLEGVKFKIIDKDGNEYETVTNDEGVARVNNIRVGNIKIKEIETIEGYVLNKEIYETKIIDNECIEVLFKNEKKKGQVEIYKSDSNDKKIKLANVEFEILDSKRKVVDKLITNENGYAISKRLETGEYYLREIKTADKYILNKDIKKINITYNEILKLNIENEKMKGKIKIIKTSSKDSPILNIKHGEFVQGVEFQIFNSKNELVDTLITDGQGEAISKKLEIGRYKIIEKNTSKYYILNSKELFVNINSNNEIKILEVENEPIIPSMNIEKVGQQIAEKNEEIKYEFDIANNSNIELYDFTFVEYIPYEYCKLTKMITGTYNKNLDYEIYYKTNTNNYKLLTRANTLVSQYINFEDIDLEKEEIITELKIEYKTVSKDFRTDIKPCIFTKINNNVKEDDEIINSTQLSGRIGENIVTDISTFKTIIKNKKNIKKLPKTGC